MQCSSRRKWLQARLGTQAAKTRARARGSEAQSGIGRGLTAGWARQLNRGHGLLSWQCERSDGSTVANGGSEPTAGTARLELRRL